MEYLYLVVIGTSIWVYFDAKSIGVRKGLVSGIADLGPGMWFIACLFLWIVSFPIYLAKRSEFKRLAQVGSFENQSIGMVFCRACGKELHGTAVACPSCGAPQKPQGNQTSATGTGEKSQTLAAVLAAFLGGVGIHRFYLGKIATGVLYILFVWTGIPLLISLVETYFIAFMSPQRWAAKYNKNIDSPHVPGIVKFLLLLPPAIIVIAFVFGVGQGVVVPVYRDYQARANTSTAILALSSCKTAASEQFQVKGAFSANNVYEFCNMTSLPKGVKALGIATGRDAVEISALLEGGSSEGKTVSMFGRGAPTGEVNWECVSNSIERRYLPSSCQYDPNWQLHTLPFRTLAESVAVVAAPLAVAATAPPQVEAPAPVATTAPAPVEAAAPAPPVEAAAPAAATAPAVSNGFTVVAPVESKDLLLSMLKASLNPLKLAQLKGEIETIQKPSTGDRKAARKLNDQGLSALQSGNYPSAIEILRRATALDPADVEVQNNFVYALLKAKLIPEAEKEAGALLTQSPGRSSAWANLAEIYAIKGLELEASSALILAFQFSGNKDKTLTFLNEKVVSSDSPLQRPAQKALQRLSSN